MCGGECTECKCKQLKTCTHCHKERPISEFGLSKRAIDGHRGECKSCRNIYEKALRDGNLEYYAAQRENCMVWSKKNKKRLKAYYKEYKKTHVEEVKRRMRNY